MPHPQTLTERCASLIHRCEQVRTMNIYAKAAEAEALTVQAVGLLAEMAAKIDYLTMQLDRQETRQ